MYEDKTLICRECGNEFIFTAGEQEFYTEKGFENEPGRCKDCRENRKRGGGGRGGEREMFEATCAACGGIARLPFRPREDGRPVYCSDCFARQKENG